MKMIEIILAFLMMTWDFLKPIIIGGFYLMLFVGIFKWWILDGVTERLDTAIIHLNTIENDVARMSRAIVNIEEELKSKSYSEYKENYNSGFSKLVDAEKNISK
jgi:hypothetical protein